MEDYEKATKEEQIKEAEKRKKMLIEIYKVAPNKLEIIKKYRKDEFYGKIIKEFEEKHHCYAYHCILLYGVILNILYVGDNKEDWVVEGPNDDGYNEILAYTYNEAMNYSEFGYIILGSKEGNIVRVG